MPVIIEVKGYRISIPHCNIINNEIRAKLTVKETCKLVGFLETIINS